MFIVTFGVQDFLTGKWSLVTIETGKSTIEDAFQVALDNGHQLDKLIRWQWKD